MFQDRFDVPLNLVGSGQRCKFDTALVVRGANDFIADSGLFRDDDLYQNASLVVSFSRTGLKIIVDSLCRLQAIYDLYVMKLKGVAVWCPAQRDRAGRQNRDAVVQPPKLGRVSLFQRR